MANDTKNPLDEFLAQSAKDWVEDELGPPRKTSEHKDPLPQCAFCGIALSAGRVPKLMHDGTKFHVCNKPMCVAKAVKRIHLDKAGRPTIPNINRPGRIEKRDTDIVVDGEEII